MVQSARITNDLDEEDDFGIQAISHLETEEPEHPSFYLNILVLSTPDAITDQKVAEMEGGPIMKKLAVHMVHRKVTKGFIAGKVAEMIPSMLPEKLSDMGIDAEADEVFRRGAFTVVRMTILKANLTKLLTMQGAEGRAARLDTAMGWGRSVARWFGAEETLDDAVNGALNRKVATKMCEKLGEVLPEKLAEKGIDLNVTALLEADEAKHFFNFLKILDADTAASERSRAADGASNDHWRPGKKMRKRNAKGHDTDTSDANYYFANAEDAELGADTLEQGGTETTVKTYSGPGHRIRNALAKRRDQ